MRDVRRQAKQAKGQFWVKEPETCRARAIETADHQAARMEEQSPQWRVDLLRQVKMVRITK